VVAFNELVAVAPGGAAPSASPSVGVPGPRSQPDRMRAHLGAGDELLRAASHVRGVLWALAEDQATCTPRGSPCDAAAAGWNRVQRARPSYRSAKKPSPLR